MRLLEERAKTAAAEADEGEGKVTLMDVVAFLRAGVVVSKYPRNRKKPEQRTVWLDTAQSGERAAVARKMTGSKTASAHDADKLLYQLGLWSGSRLMVNKEKQDTVKNAAQTKVPKVKLKHLRLGDITSVRKGKATPVLTKNPAADAHDPGLFASVVTGDRTLDLQFSTISDRNRFAEAVEMVAAAVRGAAKN